MASYQCLFLGQNGEITVAEIIEGASLSEAIEIALASLKARPHHRAVEVWEGGRKLYTSGVPLRP